MKTSVGIIPYTLVNGEMKALFMIPSDPLYGGDKPQIAKGGVDPTDRSYFAAAIREGEEELGLKISNCHVPDFIDCVTLENERGQQYGLMLWAVRVKDVNDFDVPGYETGETKWLSFNEFKEIGRLHQLSAVELTKERVEP